MKDAVTIREIDVPRGMKFCNGLIRNLPVAVEPSRDLQRFRGHIDSNSGPRVERLKKNRRGRAVTAAEIEDRFNRRPEFSQTAPQPGHAGLGEIPTALTRGRDGRGKRLLISGGVFV